MMTCGNIMKAKDVKLQKIGKSTNISCYGENSWKKLRCPIIIKRVIVIIGGLRCQWIIEE